MLIFKRGAVFTPSNYRGIHITAQLSKLAERMIKHITEPHLERNNGFGNNQFAYRKERGARDALALLVIKWITAFNNRDKIVVYCSDVAGAFDRVSAKRLIEKLYAKGVHPKIIKVFESWLEERNARVLVGGMQSAEMKIANMVFQGTVLGPMLWLVFFEDASQPIIDAAFEEIIFADDLNAYKTYSKNTRNSRLLKQAAKCQRNLHDWGYANQVQFEPTKRNCEYNLPP